MRTEKDEGSYQHLENSLRIFKALEAKAEKFDYAFQKKCVEERDYEKLEMYVMELLMGIWSVLSKKNSGGFSTAVFCIKVFTFMRAYGKICVIASEEILWTHFCLRSLFSV